MSPIGKSVDFHKEVTELEALADYYYDQVDEAVEDFESLSRTDIIEVLTKVRAREEWMRAKGIGLHNQGKQN